MKIYTVFLISLSLRVTRTALAAPPNLRGRELAKGGNGNGNNGNGNGKNGKGNGNNGDDGDVAVPTSPEVDEVGPIPPPNDDDPEVDAKNTAKLLGLSLRDAKLLLKQQKDFSEVVATLQQDNLFMQAEMPSKPDGEYIIKYKNGNIHPNHQKALDNFKVKNQNAKVKNVATKRSLKDAEARGDRLTRKLEQKDYTHISFAIDGDALELSAKKSAKHHKNKDKGKISPGRAAEILGLNADDDDLSDMSLTIEEYDAEDPIGDFHTYGGRKINGSYYQCTTGFSVISNSGTTGISTAAHCTG